MGAPRTEPTKVIRVPEAVVNDCLRIKALHKQKPAELVHVRELLEEIECGYYKPGRNQQKS